jgi:prepilin-type N-terminal cleavage/methylation domain-containing protein
MKWFYNRIYRKDKGFTLVELMVVIIILAVLTGIAIPSYLALRNRARIQATRSEMANIATALEVYNADGDGGYPDDLDDLETDGHMADVPDEDAWGVAYAYSVTGGTTYTLTSTAGTADDDSDDIVITDGQFTSD